MSMPWSSSKPRAVVLCLSRGPTPEPSAIVPHLSLPGQGEALGDAERSHFHPGPIHPWVGIQGTPCYPGAGRWSPWLWVIWDSGCPMGSEG